MSLRAKRPRINHTETARRLKTKPGVEELIGTYPAAYSAASAAFSVRTAYKAFRWYLPAGSFEARTEPVGDETGLYVRYVGGAA